MRTDKKEVKARIQSKSQIVGVAEFEIYETVAEAVDHLGEEELLSLLNAQVKTNAMNKTRQAATVGPSKKALRAQATAEIINDITVARAEDPNAYADVLGDPAAMERLTTERMGEIEQRMKAQIPEVDENEEEDEDEDE